MVKGNPVTAGVHMTPRCTVACVSAWVPWQASLTSAACIFRGGLDIIVFYKCTTSRNISCISFRGIMSVEGYVYSTKVSQNCMKIITLYNQLKR